MNNRWHNLPVWGWSVVLGLLMEGPAPAQSFSTWTSADGAQIEARFAGMEPGGPFAKESILLESRDGREFSIPVDRLNAMDQVRARLLKSGKPEHHLAFNRVHDLGLPRFEEGPVAGNFVLHETSHYLLLINSAGEGELHVKDEQGNLTGHPLPMRELRMGYRAPDDRPGREGHMRGYSREIAQYTSPPEHPLMNPDRVVLEGLLDDDVFFRKTYTFRSDTIEISYESKDPGGLEYYTRSARVDFMFPELKEIDTAMPLEERKRVLDGWRIILHPTPDQRDVSRTEILYWESEDIRPHNSERIVVEGPWDTRRVTFDFRECEGFIVVYPGQPALNGYRLAVSWRPDEVRRPSIRINIE